MRHRILGPLGATGSANHVLHVREGPKRILDAMIQPIHLVERCFGRQHRLEQECSFIELGHELGADEEREGQSRNGDRQRKKPSSTGASQGGVEGRGIDLLETPDQPDVLRFPRGSRTEHPGGDDGYESQGEDQRSRDCRDDGRREGTVHPPFDSLHPEQRKENRHHDQRCESDRASDLDRGLERLASPDGGLR